MKTSIKITVNEIAEGDEYIVSGNGWVALEDAETFANGEISVRVQHIPDGGISDRIWPSAEVELTVKR